MTQTKNSASRLSNTFRVGAVGVFLITAGALASTAYTHEPNDVAEYNCEDGDRFTVEYRQGHIRLRHGTGVFLLGKDYTDGETRFTDGQMMLNTHGQSATLEPSGPSPRGTCFVMNS